MPEISRKRAALCRHMGTATSTVFEGSLPSSISKQLGHASITTTESFYSHIIEENKAKAAECIADVLIRKKA